MFLFKTHKTAVSKLFRRQIKKKRHKQNKILTSYLSETYSITITLSTSVEVNSFLDFILQRNRSFVKSVTSINGLKLLNSSRKAGTKKCSRVNRNWSVTGFLRKICMKLISVGKIATVKTLRKVTFQMSALRQSEWQFDSYKLVRVSHITNDTAPQFC